MNLDELEALEAAATAGPWTVYEGAHPGIDAQERVVIYASVYAGKDYGGVYFPADAAFIAALRNAAPELIRLARLGARIDGLTGELDRVLADAADVGVIGAHACRAVLQEGAKP